MSDGGETSSELSASEACEAALDDLPQCPFPFGLHVSIGGSGPDATIVEVENGEEVEELDGALFVPPSEEPQVLGKHVFANEECFIGCLLSAPSTNGICIVYSDEGTAALVSPAQTVEDCEALRDEFHDR